MLNHMTPIEITADEINALLMSRTDVADDCKFEPLGLFYHRDGNLFVGIDNRTGEAWVEEFASLEECIAWLKE